MNANDSNDQEMERLLEEHFASGADNVPPPPNFWVLLEGRLGDQTPRPLWAGLRDWAFPVQGFRGASALATTAAAVAVVGVVVVVAIAGLDLVRGRRQRRRHSCGAGTSGYSHALRDANADDGVSYSALGYGCTGGGYSCTSCPHTVRNADANGDDGGSYTVPAGGYGCTAPGYGYAALADSYAVPGLATSPRRGHPSVGAAKYVIGPARSDHVRGLRAPASDRCTRGRRFHVQPGH